MKTYNLNELLEDNNELYGKIVGVIGELETLTADISTKEKRNSDAFETKRQELLEQENAVKLYSDNKYVEFFIYDSFLGETQYLNHSESFELHKEIGAYIKAKESSVYYSPKKKTIDNTKKKVIVEFEEEFLSNELKYTFIGLSGFPVAPSSIKLDDDGRVETLTDPIFRYYDRGATETFETILPFYPRRVKTLIFEFDEEINISNSSINIYHNVYDTSEGDGAVFLYENPKNKAILKFSHISDETKVPLEFYYSFDNINYTKLVEKDGEALLDGTNLDDRTQVFIKVISKYSEIIKDKNELEITYRKNSQDQIEADHIYDFSADSIQDTYDILFSHKNAKALVNQIGGETKLEDVFTLENNIYKLNQTYIRVAGDVEQILVNQLEMYDDITSVGEDLSMLNFYYSTNKDKLYAPAFFAEFPFKIEYKVTLTEELVNDSSYTPYLFEMTLKG